MAKKQIRRCANCQKVGHNKSTCISIPPLPATPQKTASSPLKFFIHHVTNEPAASPHIIDLKKEHSALWSQVETASPDPDTALYQHYHEIQPSTTTHHPATPSQPAPLHPERTTAFGKHLITKLSEKIRLWGDATASSAQNLKERAHSWSMGRHRNKPVQTIAPIFKPTVRERPSLLSRTTALFKQIIPTKGLAVVAVLLVILVIIPGPARSYYSQLESIKNTIANDGMAGFAALQDSAAALREADLDKANASTRMALTNFDRALNVVGRHAILDTVAHAMPLVGSEVVGRENILLAGQEIAVGNSYLLHGLAAGRKTASTTLLQQIDTTIAFVKAALPNYQKALEHLNATKVADVPLEYQGQFLGYRDLFGHLVNDLASLSDLGGAIHEIFGGHGLRRYLLVFQNEAELRPTGGFMGSFAVVDIKDGAIIHLEVPPGGTYDVQGQLREFVKPPTPLLLSNKRWEFQDANWFPDFPTSAEKMIWFYTHSRGVSTDGVIAINSSVLQRILAILGPVTDDKRQLTLSANSALPIIQQIVEEGPEKKLNKPKQILSDLAPQFLTALQQVPGDKILSLLTNASEALRQKEIQTYFSDAQTEHTLRSFGWTGHILDTGSNKDYVLVINTNIQGQKSDAKIHQTISHQAVVALDGSIIDNVVITREHSGSQGEKLYGQTNIDYLRLYVPKGSVLLSAGGFTWPEEKKFQVPDAWSSNDPFLAAHQTEVGIEQNSGTTINEESGKTVFGNWVITEPGQTSQVQFTYRLPFTLFSPADVAPPSGWQKILNPLAATLARYQLIVQKQSGITSDFESQIIFPENWQPEWKEGTAFKTARNGAVIERTPLTADIIWSLLMKQHSS